MNKIIDSLINMYKTHFNLQEAVFSRITHQDAMVAIVYKIIQAKKPALILKISERDEDYFRDVYFLKHFASSLPVPRILGLMPPEKNNPGAILMECLAGNLLEITELNEELAYEVGASLAYIHGQRQRKYGELTQPQHL